jgi:hypothetical protein
VDAVGLLHLGSTCVPVNLSFRSRTKTQFMDSVDGMLRKVCKPEWFGKSEHHKATEQIPQAYARFTSTIRFKRGKGPNGRIVRLNWLISYYQGTVTSYLRLRQG